jgi:hypothetical protein
MVEVSRSPLELKQLFSKVFPFAQAIAAPLERDPSSLLSGFEIKSLTVKGFFDDPSYELTFALGVGFAVVFKGCGEASF